MALTTLLASKEGPYQPILLASFIFNDNSTGFFSTHNFSTTEGGNTYNGNSYLARLAQQDITAVQARSQTGVDRVSDVTLHFNNADQFILLTYEMVSGKGFKGALVALALILCDLDPATGLYVFSTDAVPVVKFFGVCDAPQQAPGGAQTLSVRATTAHNLANVNFPIEPCQPRCINIFPANVTEQVSAATDMSSWQWGCGYSTDIGGGYIDPEIGGDPRRGNTGFSTCAYTKADCQARGMYSQDSSARKTARFKAVQWSPPIPESQSKSYVQGKNITVFSSLNQSIYNRTYPILYGTQWVRNPIVTNVIGDGNSTRGECILCDGDIGQGGVQQVVINGIIVPAVEGADPLERWNFLDQKTFNSAHTGSRNGFANTDNEYNSTGDPYGGLATIEWVVYAELAQSNSIPDIQVLTNGPRIVKYAPIATYSSGLITFPSGVANTDVAGNPPFTIQIVGCSLSAANSVWGLSSWSYGPPGTVTLSGGPAGSGTGGYIRYLAYGTRQGVTGPSGTAYVSTGQNPAWVVFDILTWANYNFQELDIPSFVAAAQYCDQLITYVDLNGNTQTRQRFIYQHVFEDTAKANEVLQASLRSFSGQLVPNSDTGLLQLFVRQTLADQQPSAIPGSNYNTAVASIHADNTTGNGFVAYLIDESVFLQDGKGVPQVEGPYSLPMAQCPNALKFPFQDADNQWQDDSISVVDPEDVTRASGYQLGGQQIPANYNVYGISSFDQGTRQCNAILAEGFRGNIFGDARGTYFWRVTTTQRLEHLRVGHICLLRFSAQQLSPSTPLQSPGGTNITGILVRVEEIQPTTDYERMTVTLRYHSDAWYTTLWGQTGAPGYSNPIKSLPARPPLPWKPYGIAPIASDSVYDVTEWSFAIAQLYGIDGSGLPIAQLPINACQPVNQFSSAIQPPQIGVQGGTANTGGSIPDGKMLVGCLIAQDSAGLWTPPSKFFSVQIPTGGTGANTAVTPTIIWGAGTVNWVLYLGYGQNTLSAQLAVGQSALIGTGTPSTITVNSLSVATFGAPDQLADSILYEIKRIYHGGDWGDDVQAVASTGGGQGTLTFLAGAWTTNQWAGYRLSLYANPLGDTSGIGIIDFTVVSNTATVLTVSPDPTLVTTPLGTGIQVGSVFVMRMKVTSTSTSITDPNLANSYAPTGLDPAAEPGHEIHIVAGTGKGQKRTITSLTAVSGNYVTINVDHAWDTNPDATSIPIITETTWQTALTSKLSNSAVNFSPPQTVATLDVSNYRKQSILVRARVLDQNSNSSVRRWSPEREAYLWGSQGTRLVTANTTMMLTDGTVQFDTSVNGADITYQCLPFSQVPNVLFIWQRMNPSDGHSVFIVAATGDSFDAAGTTTYTLTDNANGSTGTAVFEYFG